MGFLDFISPGQKNRMSPLQSTQTYLRFGEIRDNTLVLKNGGMRSILKVTSINFNLKSEQEQNAIIFSYQNFLNSLEFPVQILIRSKKLNIDNYIDQIDKLGEKQTNPLLKEQTKEYSVYIKTHVEYADIMEKEFYIIIPYDPGRVQGQLSIQKFFARLAPKDSYLDIKRRHAEFNHTKKGLVQRVNVVKSGLANCGLKANELNTIEIINLFYKTYNPNISRSAKLKQFEETSIHTEKEHATEEKEFEKEVTKMGEKTELKK